MAAFGESGSSSRVRIEDRQLDAIVAHAREAPDQRQQRLLRRVVGPQQQVHAEFHALKPCPVVSGVEERNSKRAGHDAPIMHGDAVTHYGKLHPLVAHENAT
jgi:hypothetical protein